MPSFLCRLLHSVLSVAFREVLVCVFAVNSLFAMPLLRVVGVCGEVFVCYLVVVAGRKCSRC